jgi:endonuclease YncB( thermonuclease family)
MKTQSNQLLFVAVLLLSANGCGQSGPVDYVLAKKVQESFKARVANVVDGDSLVVVNEHNTETQMILEGIDAPEPKQEYGNEATKELQDMVLNRELDVLITGKDNYGRKIGVLLDGSANINLLMVDAGFAWHLSKYSTSADLAKAEQAARKEKRGLWSTKNLPEAPWDFRLRMK